MKRSATAAIFMVMLAAASLPLRAQQRQISLDDAISLALANNRTLEMARLEIGKADAQVDEAFGNALPSLNFSANYTRNIQKQVFYFPGPDGVTRPISIGSDNALQASLQLQQILFNSAVLTGVGTAKTYSQISRQQLRATAAETVVSVKKLYYGALLGREVLALNERLLRNAEQNFQTARQFVQNGMRAEFDAIRAEVQVENLRPVVVQARDSYQMALDNLEMLLGLDPATTLELTGTLSHPADTVTPAITTANDILERNNAQLQALRLATTVNEQLIDINRSDYLPTLALFGNYTYQAQADAFSDLDFQPSSMVGLNLSLNLFSGGQTKAKVEQARVDYLQSLEQLEQVDQALKTQLESVLRRIYYARERIAASDHTITQAERGYKIATVSYGAGTGTQLQINDAELALAQSRLNQLNAIYDYHGALADLEGLLGERFKLTGSEDNNVIYAR